MYQNTNYNRTSSESIALLRERARDWDKRQEELRDESAYQLKGEVK